VSGTPRGPAADAGGARSLVTLALPCRTDEPSLGHTLEAAAASWAAAEAAATHALEVLVCLNGAGEGTAARAALAAFAARRGVPVTEIDLDRPGAGMLPALAGPLAVAILHTRRAGKAIAWNLLRARARGPRVLFLDADVGFAPEAFARLLATLDAAPDAVLASARTTCAPRPGWFERVMAAPYRVSFPNLSPQLYAARLPALPAPMPEDLIEPERWLELTVGRGRVVRAPGVTVAVRLPGTLRDFFRQRIRIEMGKVQIARVYPGLSARGEPQPGVRAVAASIDPATGLALAAYLGLRSLAHVVAWWRWRRGETGGIWRQAVTTKRWDAA
jgi:hypothetical protein